MKYPFEALFSVCTGERCNAEERGAECGAAIRDVLKDLNRKSGRKPTVRITATSCLDLCDHGPNMLVWPAGTVFSHLTRDLAVEAYRGVMGDGPRREDLELGEAEFEAGNSWATKKNRG